MGEDNWLKLSDAVSETAGDESGTDASRGEDGEVTRRRRKSHAKGVEYRAESGFRFARCGGGWRVIRRQRRRS